MGKLPEGLVVIWNGPKDYEELKRRAAELEACNEIPEDPWDLNDDYDLDWNDPR